MWYCIREIEKTCNSVFLKYNNIKNITSMEKFKELSHSVKRFVRTQKAQIRRQFLDVKKQEEMIKEMYNKLNAKAVV